MVEGKHLMLKNIFTVLLSRATVKEGWPMEFYIKQNLSAAHSNLQLKELQRREYNCCYCKDKKQLDGYWGIPSLIMTKATPMQSFWRIVTILENPRAEMIQMTQQWGNIECKCTNWLQVHIVQMKSKSGWKLCNLYQRNAVKAITSNKIAGGRRGEKKEEGKKKKKTTKHIIRILPNILNNSRYFENFQHNQIFPWLTDYHITDS